MYRTLDSEKIVATLERLQMRIEDRFPGRGLGAVCRELTGIAVEAKTRAEQIAAPNVALRIAVGSVLAVGIMLLVSVLRNVDFHPTGGTLFGVAQGIEATINVIVLTGAAALFLVTLESRVKRKRALDDLHGLRAIVHVIDMHQLTKDPAMAFQPGRQTPSSPVRKMDPFELVRYLDYCSEMLSLTGKVGALYAQSLSDRVVVGAVNDIEVLTTNLARKIWQKIMILETYGPGAMSGPAIDKNKG
ncbi:MAG: hypothetical protein C0606_06765 [Hyphomicrobiales bacterium]|nr:MAG: hypothetical protein C0606_06765 [Hyphomicrobiales bacterium]